VAYTGAPGGKSAVVRRTADGVWRSFAIAGRVTALAFVDDVGTLVAAAYSDADDASALVRVDPAGGIAIVAQIDAGRSGAGEGLERRPRADGRVAALALDEAHGVLWAVGGFGVAAFAVRAR
jgi:hypothetical protein